MERFLPKTLDTERLYYHEEDDVWGLGYNLCSAYWKKGLTLEVMTRIIEYAKENYEAKKIAGTFAVDNYGSRRVMEKLGMKFLENTEYSKFDGSVTFKAKTYSMEI